MSPAELSEGLLRRLAADIDSELPVLDELAVRIASCPGPSDDPLANHGAQAWLALELHRYYTAVEATLERIARDLDGHLPTGAAWHKGLLRQQSQRLPGVRPSVLDAETTGELTHLLSFRHFLRHAYAVQLDWQQLQTHRERVARIHPNVRASLGGLADHLRRALRDLLR